MSSIGGEPTIFDRVSTLYEKDRHALHPFAQAQQGALAYLKGGIIMTTLNNKDDDHPLLTWLASSCQVGIIWGGYD